MHEKPASSGAHMIKCRFARARVCTRGCMHPYPPSSKPCPCRSCHSASINRSNFFFLNVFPFLRFQRLVEPTVQSHSMGTDGQNLPQPRRLGTPLDGGFIESAQSPEAMPVLLQAAGPTFCSLFVAWCTSVTVLTALIRGPAAVEWPSHGARRHVRTPSYRGYQ
jgi:hypothetical protein